MSVALISVIGAIIAIVIVIIVEMIFFFDPPSNHRHEEQISRQRKKIRTILYPLVFITFEILAPVILKWHKVYPMLRNLFN